MAARAHGVCKAVHAIRGKQIAVKAAKRQRTGRTFSRYCNCAYSASACFRTGMSGSASFHSVRKSL